MKRFLDGVRTPDAKKFSGGDIKILFLLFSAGLISGAAAKLFDIYTQNLGNIFSQLSVWIFLGTLISVYSRTAIRAGGNVFSFCCGMMISYYTAVALSDNWYYFTPHYIIGWSLFTLFCPLLAFLTWYSCGCGWFSKLISAGILICIPLSAVLFFHCICFSDIVIFILCALLLYLRHKRLHRTKT